MTLQAQSRRDVLTGTGAVIIAAAFLAGVYFPGRARTQETERRLAAALRTLKDAPRRARQVEELRDGIQHAEAYLQAAPHRRAPLRTSNVIEFTSTLAAQAKVSLLRLEPLPGEVRQERTAWPVEVVCEGPASAVAAFLVGLETGPRLTTIHEVALDVRAAPRPVVEGRIRFSLYADSADSAGFAKFDASRTSRRSDQSQ
jgi:hypothetical protein